MKFRIGDIVKLANTNKDSTYGKMRGKISHYGKWISPDDWVIYEMPYVEWNKNIVLSIIYTNGLYNEDSLELVERPQLDLFD